MLEEIALGAHDRDYASVKTTSDRGGKFDWDKADLCRQADGA
jgi:hypothetical protein